MKYANLIENKNDLVSHGNNIQLIAVDNLYKWMGVSEKDIVRIPTAEIFSYDGPEYLILPINLLFMGKYKKISDKIIPVYLGLSMINQKEISNLRLREYEPVGCRDYETFDLLRKNGVKCWLNGCLTITLPRRNLLNKNKEPFKKDKIYVVDVSDKMMKYIPDEIRNKMEFLYENEWGREITAKESMQFYEKIQRESRLVITGRLHIAAPCIAYGIPVILGQDKASFRMDWIQKYIPVYTEESYESIDWNPKSLDIEKQKVKILETSARRIKALKEYYSFLEISEEYESVERLCTSVDDLIELTNYIDKNWKKDREYKYCMWGITSVSDLLFDYISKNYPKAKLTGVIDVYRKRSFKGVKSKGIDFLKDVTNQNMTVFVTARHASKMAKEELSKYRISYITVYGESTHFG